MSGVSSGSDQALELGLAHPETFAYLGGFIGGLYNCAVREEARGDAQGPAPKKRLELLWLASGKNDLNYD